MIEIGSIALSVQIDSEMRVVVAAGSRYRIHSGGGIVVYDPGRPPCWIRMENGHLLAEELPPKDSLVVRLVDQPKP